MTHRDNTKILEEYTKKLAILRQFYTTDKINNLPDFIGGGGGSRTRVRKHSAQASTYIARQRMFVPWDLPGMVARELTSENFRFTVSPVRRLS